MNKHSLWTELNLNWNSGALFNVQPSHAEQLLGILKKGEARGGVKDGGFYILEWGCAKGKRWILKG